MNTRSLSGVVGLVALLGAWDASAQACQDDAQCPRGLVCEVVSDGGCAGTPPCAGGDQECPEPEPCTVEEVRACRPGPCTTDADCGEGLTCYTHTETECSGGSPPCAGDGAECPPPEPEVCVDTTESLCVPPYVLPCTADTDCGGGFVCTASERCDCNDVAIPASPSDGGAAEPVPVPADCICEPTSRCELVITACTSAAQCPTGWTCEPNPEGVCSSSSDGAEPVCTPADPPQLCIPPYAEGIGGVATDDEGSTPTAGGPERSSTASSGDSGGCALVASGRTASDAWPLAVLGLALAALRRRRR